MQLAPRDLYRLRRARLLAQRAALRAQFAQHQLQELSLEIKRRYGLLSTEAVLDVQTGMITPVSPGSNGSQPHKAPDPDAKEEVTGGPAHNADQSPA